MIGWIGQRAFPDRYGGAVGVGGAAYSSGYRLANGDPVLRAVQGGVMLNAGYNDDISNGFGSGFTWGEVLMHELGHVIGLSHVDSTKQLMYRSITRGAARFGAGDLNGFRKVGDTFGCLGPRQRPGALRPAARVRLPLTEASGAARTGTRTARAMAGPGCFWSWMRWW